MCATLTFLISLLELLHTLILVIYDHSVSRGMVGYKQSYQVKMKNTYEKLGC